MARSPKMPTDSKQTQPLPKPPPRRTQKEGRVLVVDDETAICDAICEFLDVQNIQADKANDGHEAIKLLKKNTYDAVISDIRMPGLDGPQLYEQATTLDPSYQNRFLFMSGDMVRDSTQGFVSSLNCPCLSKPFALQVLFQELQTLLGHEGAGLPATTRLPSTSPPPLPRPR